MMKFTIQYCKTPAKNKSTAGTLTKYDGRFEFDSDKPESIKEAKKLLQTYNHTLNIFQNDDRSKNSPAIGCTGIMLDIDGGNVEAVKKYFSRTKHLMATSTSHSPDKPCWHLYLPFSKPILLPQKQLRQLFNAVKKKLNKDGIGKEFDLKTLEPKRHFYPNFTKTNFQFLINDTGDCWSVEEATCNSGIVNDVPSDASPNRQPDTSDNQWPEIENSYLNDNWIELDKYLSYCVEHPITKGERDNEFIRLAAKFRQCDYTLEQTFQLLNNFNEECVVEEHKLQSTGDSYSGDKSIEQIVKHVWEDDLKPPEPTEHNWPKMFEAINNEYPSPLFDLELPNVKLESAFEHKLTKMTPSFGLDGVYTLTERIKVGLYNNPPVTAMLGIVVFGSHTILVGESGDGKTTLAQSVAIQEAKQGKTTLYVTAETDPRPDHIWERMLGKPVCDLIHVFDVRLLKKIIPYKKRFEYLIRLVSTIKPDFVIFDTLHSVFSWIYPSLPDLSDMAKWQDYAQKLGRIAISAGATPLTLHHFNKTGRYAGSGGLKAGGDNMLNFRLSGGKNKFIRKITVEKSRDGLIDFSLIARPDNNYHYEIYNKTDSEDDDKIKLSADEQKVLDVLKTGKQVKRRALQRQFGLDKSSLDKIQSKLQVKREIKNNKSEVWWLTPDQINQFA